MTRARAIELLKGIQFCCDFDDCTNAWDCDECVDAFNMAIEALEQEPTAEYSSDVISRQAVLNLAKEGKLLSGNIYKKASDYINELPSADRPTGFWHIDAGVGCFCSKCGFDIGNDFDFMEYVRFCPYCGARMESEE